jgi:thiosulfate/3-mercaptopyruvate sulfurtransferase
MPKKEESMLRGTASRAALVLLGAAVAGPAIHSTYAQQTTQPALRSEMLVSTSWLQQHLSDPDLVVLYVGRDRGRFNAGHIPGSVFVRLDDLVEQRKNSLNDLPPVSDLQALFESLGVGDNSRIVLTGDGQGLLAARAYFTLDYLGHGDHAALLDGGTEKWHAEARTVSKEDAHPTRSHFTPHVQPEVLISTPQMQDASRDLSHDGRKHALLDARPAAEYDGIVASEAVPKAGHIAGAHSLHWKKLIRSDADPQLLDTAELQRQFLSAGAEAGDTVITYCRTGMQSSFAYFVAKYLGYRVAMYDGSVYEWVNAAGNDLVLSPTVENQRAAQP